MPGRVGKEILPVRDTAYPRERRRVVQGSGLGGGATPAERRSGQIAESARPTAIPNETSKKRCMAICQPLVERGDTPAASEAVALVSPSA
jgi:hypothetical protein